MTCTELIAEIGQAHDGSLGQVHSYIDALAAQGVRVIKFQTHVAEAESSAFDQFRTNFSFVDKTRFDYWKRMEFSVEQWFEIAKHCESLGVEFMSTPSCVAAFEILERLGVKRYKLGSGDFTNFLLIERIAQTGKPLIASVGLANENEIGNVVPKFYDLGIKDLTLMQCTSKYPTRFEDIGLRFMSKMKEKFGCKVGLSDHSSSIYPSIAAAVVGASSVEVHVVFDKRIFGPDSSSSLTLDEIAELVKGLSAVEKMMSIDFEKVQDDELIRTKNLFDKSLALNVDALAGEKITLQMLESKKPHGYGFPASRYTEVIGKTLKRNLEQWSFLTWEDLDD